MNNLIKKIPSRGFTLIELLVVMTVIVVISTVAMVSYAGSGKKTRDSRRMADLEKIRIALEMIKQVGNTYPESSDSLIPNYLQSWPVDPKQTAVYRYTQLTNYTYNLDAVVEDVGSTTGHYIGGYNYRVTNF